MPGPFSAGIPLPHDCRCGFPTGSWTSIASPSAAPRGPSPFAMRVDLLTIFPEYFAAVLDLGMIRIARERGLLDVRTTNLREFTDDTHRTTDDKPFGGGAGMVMLAEPIFR